MLEELSQREVQDLMVLWDLFFPFFTIKRENFMLIF